LLVGNLAHPGSSFNVDPKTLDARAVADYAGQAKAQNITDFLVHIIPNTIVDAFSRGDILQVLLVSVLFGFALSLAGPRCKPFLDVMDSLTRAVFGVVAILMRFAPIGAFGAMAFTIGKYGLASLGPLVKLIATLYLTSFFFVIVVLGLIARVAGFGILKFLWFIREEILLVLATSSSEPALPSLMAKLQRLGCSKALVGLVVPTGYTFNADGTSLYMTLAALFVAQATNTDLTMSQQIAIFAVAMLTSKGASGVTGASFIALVGTLSVVPTIPVAGMALILGIDRFMSEARALVNVIGNGVATIVISRTEGELDLARVNSVLGGNETEAEGTSAALQKADARSLPARNQI
jgi:aerobic C4-dicarboxylate transport protein